MEPVNLGLVRVLAPRPVAKPRPPSSLDPTDLGASQYDTFTPSAKAAFGQRQLDLPLKQLTLTTAFNERGDGTVLISPDGARYTVSGGNSSKTISALDADNTR